MTNDAIAIGDVICIGISRPIGASLESCMCMQVKFTNILISYHYEINVIVPLGHG